MGAGGGADPLLQLLHALQLEPMNVLARQVDPAVDGDDHLPLGLPWSHPCATGLPIHVALVAEDEAFAESLDAEVVEATWEESAAST